jgi:heat shock protein HslJ
VDPALVGTEWFLTLLGGDEPLPQPRLTLEIGSEDVGGFSGCNWFGGAIDRMDDGKLVWSNCPSDGFASTLVGCPGPDLLRQEKAYQKAVLSTETYRLDGDRLELKNGQSMLVFSEKPQWRSDPDDLVSTSWVLHSTDGEKPPEGSVPTLEFGPGKKVRWYDDCQNFSGTYTATENDLALPDYDVVVAGDCMKPRAFGDHGGPCEADCFLPEGDYRLRDGSLEIRSETGTTTSILEPLAEKQEPAQKGTPWDLRAFVEGGKTTPVPGGVRITLIFDRGTLREEGTMFGSAGCNTYSVDYAYPVARNSLDHLELEKVAVTKKRCPYSPDVMDFEQRYLSFLEDVRSYPTLHSNGELRLQAPDRRVLVFSAPG